MVSRKEKITLLFLALFIAVAAQARNDDTLRHDSKEHKGAKCVVEYGIKAGFNSSMFLIDKFVINEVSIDELQNNYKTGYNLSLFARLNFKRHFVQLAPEFSNVNGEITFDKKGSQHPDIEPDYATIDANLKTFNFHLLYGYSLISEKPYGLALFAGPTLKYIWRDKSRIEYMNFSESMSETINPFCINVEIGVSVKISYLFLDFSYEIGLSNVSKRITDLSDPTASITLDRRNNVLNFSLGFTF